MADAPKNITVTIRMPADLKHRLDLACEREHRSLSQQIVYMLTREFEHPTKKRKDDVT